MLYTIVGLILATISTELNAQGTEQSQPDLSGLTWSNGAGDSLTFDPQLVGRPMFPSDFTATDLNRDGRLDLTIAAHSVPPEILINRGDLRFQASPTALGVRFHQDVNLVAPEPHPPTIAEKGLFLFMEGTSIRMVGRGLSTDVKPIRLLAVPGPGKRPTTLSPLEVLQSEGDVLVERAEDPHELNITFGRDFSLTMAPGKEWFQFDAIAMLPKDLSFDQIRLGSEARSAASYLVRFTATMAADWHALAWVDLNDDERVDLFVVQGGVLGEAPQDDRALNDLLWLSHNQHLRSEVAEAVGITKAGAPGRGVDLVDVDRNGLLDLYIRNSRANEPRKNFPNALHLQLAPMRFEEWATEAGLALRAEGRSVWLDLDDDLWIDLVWGDSTGLTVYRNHAGKFSPEAICSEVENVYALTVGDVDRDGDADLVAAAWPNMSLVLMEDGAATCIDPESVGLPKFSGFVQLVDINGDGRLDVFTDPHGVYLQRQDGGFVRTGLLENSRRKWKQYLWADFNGDGRVDLASLERSDLGNVLEQVNIDALPVEIRRFNPAKLWIYENTGRPNMPWLQLDLVGPPGNAPAIGTRALVSAGGVQQGAIVGQFEGSQGSDGHRRLYFGFAADTTEANVDVFWPDGSTSSLDSIQLRSRQTIRHPARSVE